MAKKFNKLLIKGTVLMLTMACCIRAADSAYIRSDFYARERAVKLKSAKGSCSGEQIEAFSGDTYILTAAHCRMLSEDGVSIKVITENGAVLMRKIIAEDSKSDLLLLEGIPNLSGIPLATSAKRLEYVKTFTMGKGFDTFKTEGVLIGVNEAAAIIGLVGDKGNACEDPKYKIVNVNEYGQDFAVCVLQVKEMTTTASISPGSSGGMVLNSTSELVGVVSMGDGTFGYLVTIEDIRAFLAGY